MTPKLYIARTPDGNGFALPTYESQYHVGLRLQAAIGTTLKINPNERVRIPIGFAIGVPQGFCGQVVSDPALAEKHGVIVSGAPHVVNPVDRDALFVLLQNVSSSQYILHRGEVIAELLIVPAVQVSWNEISVAVHDETTDEGTLVVDEGVEEENTPKKDPFASFRRPKRSIRNRFKEPSDDDV